MPQRGEHSTSGPRLLLVERTYSNRAVFHHGVRPRARSARGAVGPKV